MLCCASQRERGKSVDFQYPGDDTEQNRPPDDQPRLLSGVALADWKTEFHKACWRTVSLVPGRSAMSLMFGPDTRCFYDVASYPNVRGKLALTIDDAPCRDRDPKNSMISDVMDLLREFKAQATFFLCTDYVEGYEEPMAEALREGHEVANHCPEDRSYADDGEADFEAALLRAEEVCERLRGRAGEDAPAAVAEGAVADAPRTLSDDLPPALAAATPLSPLPARPRWFRAPHAKMSSAMRQVLSRHGYTNVLTDCYANDPWISDADFLARTMLGAAADGSVAVIHMPERGFREYNLRAMRLFLEGLRDRGISVVTLGSLHAEALRPNSDLPL